MANPQTTMPPVPKDPIVDRSGKTPPSWMKYFAQIQRVLSFDGGVAWGIVNKIGSKLTDIETRTHAMLQSVLGWSSGTDATKDKHISQQDGKNWEDHRLDSSIHHTFEEIQDNVASFIVAGDNIEATYDDAANTLTIAVKPPTIYTASSINLNTGTLVSGSVTDTHGLNVSYYTVQEVAGVVGFDIELVYTGVVSFNKVQFHENYHGSPSHVVEIGIYNKNTLAWDILESINAQGTLTYKSYDIVSSAPYIDSGTTKLRFYHSSPGNATHQMIIDYAVLKDEIGSSIMDHGQLDGLGDDDHPQYTEIARRFSFWGN